MNYRRTNPTSDFYSDSDQMSSPHHPLQSPMTAVHGTMIHQAGFDHHVGTQSPAHSMQHSPAIHSPEIHHTPVLHSPAIHPQAAQMMSPPAASPAPAGHQSLPYSAHVRPH